MSKQNQQGYHEHIVVDLSGNAMCELCNQIINNDHKLIEQHCVCQMNNIRIFDEYAGCLLCRKTMSHTTIYEHIECTDHIKKLSILKDIVVSDGGFILLPGTKRNPTPTLKCLACDEHILFILEHLHIHLSSYPHDRAKAMALQPLNGIVSVEDTDELYCKICQVYMDNYIQVILDHVHTDSAHSRELGKLKGLIGEEDIDIKDYLFDPNEDKARCKKCGIEVPCNVDNLERHIKGKQHKKNCAATQLNNT